MAKLTGTNKRKDPQDLAEEKKRAELEMLEKLHTSKDQMADDKEIRYTAVCVTACTFRGQYWHAGREYRGFVKPPKHFEITEEIGLDAAGSGEQSVNPAGRSPDNQS